MSNRANNLSSLPVVGIFLVLFGLSLKAQPASGLIPATASFQNRSETGNPVKDYRRRFKQGGWIKVSGFADSKYFYGQLQLLEKRKVAGYLYRPQKGPIYVYGKVIRPGEFRVFDKKGTQYRLLIVEEGY